MIKTYSDFDLKGYDFELPKSAIAQTPANPRESAKLLVYDRASGCIWHSDFSHFSAFVPKDSLIVFNDTKVLKARIYAHKLLSHKNLSERKYEIFYHKALGDNLFVAQIRGSVRIGDKFVLKPENVIINIIKRLNNGMRLIKFSKDDGLLDKQSVLELLEKYGHIPLPPYIKRADNALDSAFYQSTFAKIEGSVAAPTASLHFDKATMDNLQSSFNTCFITLHIGAGTFMGVESADIREHNMQKEQFCIDTKAARAIDSAKHVLCIGTTSARCVEYYARHKVLSGECDIFLYPGCDFKRVNALLTNFHLPKSTLIMLVSALIGKEKCLWLYDEALKNGYRFYSYGDGMLIL